MHTLLHYIKVRQGKRLSRKVLVSYVTFKEVSTSTVARWLKCVLEMSGINTKTFKAHSFRAASVSAAFNRGCSLKTILDTVSDWSSDKNFRKFCCRQSLRKDQVSFVYAVFQIWMWIHNYIWFCFEYFTSQYCFVAFEDAIVILA